MTNSRHTAATEEAWCHVEQLADEVAGLISTAITKSEFYRGLIQRVVQAGAADGAIVWQIGPGGRTTALCHVGAAAAAALRGDLADPARRRFLDQCIDSDEPRIVSPRDTDCLESQHPAQHQTVVCPVRVEGATVCIVQVLQRSGVPRNALQTFADVLATFCDLAADFHRRHRLRQLETQQASSVRLDAFCAAVYRYQGLSETSYAVAHEARRLIGCDRASVTLLRGRRATVQAISGVDVFDRRSPLVRAMESMVGMIVVDGDILVSDGSSEDLSPQVEQSLQALIDQSHARVVTVLPLCLPETAEAASEEKRPVGAVVVEWFQLPAEGLADRVHLETVRRHANLALRRALYLHRVPFLRLLQWFARFRDTGTVVRWLLAAALVAAVIAALVLVPAELTVSSQGRLEPQRQRNIFAPQDSQIEELHVAHGDLVKQGQELVTLRSRDLDFEFARVLGELQTTAEQFESARTTRLMLRPQTAEERREHAGLTAEEERLQRLLESLTEQKRLLEQVRTSLRLCSPLDGRVLTWQLDETLRQRPVRRGQTLMTIGDLQGPWILQLDVADRDLGYVLEARNPDRRPLEVTFSLATAPGQTFRGAVQEVALRVDPDDSRQPKATVTVAIAGSELGDPRPGASVAARIRCGQHRLGYVWLRDLIETVRTWLVF